VMILELSIKPLSYEIVCILIFFLKIMYGNWPIGFINLDSKIHLFLTLEGAQAPDLFRSIVRFSILISCRFDSIFHSFRQINAQIGPSGSLYKLV
jgi:hypothetical protein